jgi:hypothetical protein
MKKILLFLMVVCIVSIGILTTTFDTNINLPEKQNFELQSAFAANPFDCSMTEVDIASITNGYKTPKAIPDGFTIKDAFNSKGELGLFYATEEMCGPNATQKSFSDGVIMFYTANKESGEAKIAYPEKYFDEYKTNSDYPDRITITEIAGHTAMMWDSGMEKNLFIDENGSLFAEEEVPYPAQITIVDKEGEALYMVKGHVSLDTLETMIKSAILS